MYVCISVPPLWFQVIDQEVRVRFPVQPEFLRSNLGFERNPLSLVNTTEEILGRKSRGSSLGNRDYGRRGFDALATRHPSIRKG
jgi:hypothetical protein